MLNEILHDKVRRQQKNAIRMRLNIGRQINVNVNELKIVFSDSN